MNRPHLRSFSSIAITSLAIAALLPSSEVAAQPAGFNYDESSVPDFALPELLKAQDGSAVTSAQQWHSKRRPEVLALFQDHVFGHQPDVVPQLRIRERSCKQDALGGKAVRREITVFFSDDDNGPSMDILVYTPAAAETPVPCFMGFNFHGNHSVDPDQAIHITTSWVRN
ncbi:MAG: hypothetical protein ABGZ24_11100, partial [Fuerstiella sp.]